jgi:pyruvate-formate lyase-activating enzyme
VLNLELVERYRQGRVPVPPGTPVCLSPITNLHFLQRGIVTDCCTNTSHVLGVYPRDSVAQIWNGEPVRRLREALTRNDLSLGCQKCEQQFSSEDFRGFHGQTSDLFVDYLERVAPEDPAIPKRLRPLELLRPSSPRTLEFDIHNTCNLECVMCTGERSSRIRSRRMGEPPIPNPYDEAFLDQIEPFLPQVVQMRFAGGEPFLIKLYYDLWERIAERFPRMQIMIVSNGTIANDRVIRLLERLDVTLDVSIDSIHKSTYESIRVGASFDEVMDNCRRFQQILQAQGKKMNWRHCVMRQNWMEVPDILRHCNENDIRLGYNPLDFPVGLSVHTLPPKEIKLIVDYWRRAAVRPPETETQENNAEGFRALIQRTEAFTRPETRRQTVGVLQGLLGDRKEKQKPGTMALPLAPEPEPVSFPMMVFRYIIYRILFDQERQCGEAAALPEGAEENLAVMRERIRAHILQSPGSRALEDYMQTAVRAYVSFWGPPEGHSLEVFKRASILPRLIVRHRARLQILDELLAAPPAKLHKVLVSRRDAAGLEAFLREYWGAA